jgi:hypothetical protein
MSDTFENVVKNFEGAGVLFRADPEKQTVWAMLTTEEANWMVFVSVEEEVLQVAVHHPLRIREDKRAAVAEFIVRVGPRNNICRLEMGYDEGRVMTRTRMYFDPESGLGDELIHATISCAVCALDRVHSALIAILHQGKTAAEAAQMLEEKEVSEQGSPHANRFNLLKREDDVPWPELPEEGLRKN